MTQETIYDPIRKMHVAATPEEKVRQRMLHHMLQMGFPAALIAVEKNLADIIPLSSKKPPSRRIDIVCFSKKDHSPLLMIECKAKKITRQALLQVMGYNRLVQAPFIGLCSQDHLMIACWDHQTSQYAFLDHLQSYEKLLNAH